MAVEKDARHQPHAAHAARGAFFAIAVAAAGLTKFAKHLALFASLAIIGTANGRHTIGQVAILLLVVAAALLHSFGASLRRIADRSVLPRR